MIFIKDKKLSPLSDRVISYCASRGVSEETMERFDLVESLCGNYVIIPVHVNGRAEPFYACRNIADGRYVTRYRYAGDIDREAIFGLNQLSAKRDRAILVEGYFDVMTSYENGYRNVVANIGCATVDQPWWDAKASLLVSMFSRVDVAFDGFPGGHPQQRAAVADFRRRGILSNEIILPPGIDPAMLSKDQMAIYFDNNEQDLKV